VRFADRVAITSASPEEIAAVVAFRGDASFVTGAALTADAARLAKL
jgi:hypothetical protein